MSKKSLGFTLVELMITVVITAIGLSIAVPSWNSLMEKREVTSAAEEIVSFLTYAQSEAVKRNERSNVSWYASGHSDSWCIGLNLGDTACDCTVTDTGAANFCQIDGAAQRLVQTDFVEVDYDFLHTSSNFNNNKFDFAFDPIRGIVDVAGIQKKNIEGRDKLLDMFQHDDSNDYMFYLHSNEKHDNKRLYELQVWINITGRAEICTDDDRRSIVGGYPICP